MRWLKKLFASRKPAQQPLTPDLLSEIRRSFEHGAHNEEHFPSTIDPRIYHVKIVLRQVGEGGKGRILDAGCGKGRFAHIVKRYNPQATVVAMDLAEAMLRYAESDLARVAGSLHDLPFSGESFDSLYATESLEHAVDIDRSVAELCRVLKPGGRLVIIDKNAEHWGRLETPAWETWFHKKELLKLLRRHCRQVEAHPVSYWEDVPPDGLFLAWLAQK